MIQLHKKILATFLILFASVMISNGQSSTSASATIISPLELTITQQQETYFSAVQTSSINSNEVFLKTKKSREGKKVEMIEEFKQMSVANFSVKNGNSAAYSIIMPESVLLTHTTGQQTLKLSTLVNKKKEGMELVSNGQDFDLSVVLPLNECKLNGLYSSELLPVTIIYN